MLIVFPTQESFYIRTELLLSREEMLAAVKKGPWKRAVETLLSRKKQFLEDMTNKQILSSRWQLEERERKAFRKQWASFSKEESSHVMLEEINQKTVVRHRRTPRRKLLPSTWSSTFLTQFQTQ